VHLCSDLHCFQVLGDSEDGKGSDRVLTVWHYPLWSLEWNWCRRRTTSDWRTPNSTAVERAVSSEMDKQWVEYYSSSSGQEFPVRVTYSKLCQVPTIRHVLAYFKGMSNVYRNWNEVEIMAKCRIRAPFIVRRAGLSKLYCNPQNSATLSKLTRMVITIILLWLFSF